MFTEGFREYMLSPQFLDDWNTGHSDIVPVATRARAAAYSVFYGILINPTFWGGAACFATIMTATSGYGFVYNLVFYVRAVLISYMFADKLPLKSFSSDGKGPMNPVNAAVRNSMRMILPLLGSGLANGVFAPGYSLFALVAFAAVEAGKHALFHARTGLVLVDWTMLTDLLERRLAVTGLSMPPNIRVIENILARDDMMDVDTKQTPS